MLNNWPHFGQRYTVFAACHLTTATSDAATMMIQEANPKGQCLGTRINAVRMVVAMNAIRAEPVFKESTSQCDLNCKGLP